MLDSPHGRRCNSWNHCPGQASRWKGLQNRLQICKNDMPVQCSWIDSDIILTRYICCRIREILLAVCSDESFWSSESKWMIHQATAGIGHGKALYVKAGTPPCRECGATAAGCPTLSESLALSSNMRREPNIFTAHDSCPLRWHIFDSYRGVQSASH